jgi:serine/threonine-protein kinase
MVTGQKSFAGDSSFAVMQAQVENAPAPPVELDPTIPPALDAAILTALEKDPEHRFASADAFRLALEEIIQGVPIPASPPPHPERRPWLVPALQFAAASAVILPVAYYAGARRPREEWKFTPPVIEIRMPAPPPVVEAQAPAAEPDPLPARRRPLRARRSPARDLTPTVIGEEPRPTQARVIEPVRHAAEPAPPAPEPPPHPEIVAAAPEPPEAESADDPTKPAKEKKPNVFRRAINKIFSHK